MKSSPLPIAALLIWVLTTSLHASLILGLAFDDASTSKVINNGDSVLINLFLSDTDTSTSLMAEGLLTGAGSLTQTSGSALLNLSGTSIGTNAWGSWFGPGLQTSTPAGALAGAHVFANPGSVVGKFASSIHLAQFGFTVSGAAGDNAILTAGVLGGANTNTSGSFQNLDTILTGGSGSFGSIDVTIAAVPEPSFMLFAPLLITIITLTHRRRPHKARVGSAHQR